MKKKDTTSRRREEGGVAWGTPNPTPSGVGLGEDATSGPPALGREAELLNDLQRTRADFENFRKQTDLQKQQAIEAAKNSTVSILLPLLDDIDRAIAAYPEQLAPLAKNLDKTYKELNLEKINSVPDADFNPDFHDAVMVEDGEGDKEVIAETLRPGYLYRGSVLRPAMVKVKRV